MNANRDVFALKMFLQESKVGIVAILLANIVGSTEKLGNTLLLSKANHRHGHFQIGGTVVYAKQIVTVNIDHGTERCCRMRHEITRAFFFDIVIGFIVTAIRWICKGCTFCPSDAGKKKKHLPK